MFFLAFFFTAAVITAASLAFSLSQSHPVYGDPLRTSIIHLPISSNSPESDYLRLIGIGGCREVGRSCFLLQSPKFNLLLDCGIKLPDNDIPALLEIINPQDIDAIIITHAHADHYGYLPTVVQSGFKGIVFGTDQTWELMKINFEDTNTFNLSAAEINQIYNLWHSVSPGTVIKDSHLTIKFLPAGHILGAVMAEIEYGGKRLLYSGDFGNESFTVNPYELPLSQYDLLITESTYGAKHRGSIDEEVDRLINSINQAIDRDGTVVIPSFAVGRAQEILTILGKAREQGLISTEIPVYVDGMIRDTNQVYLNSLLSGTDYLDGSQFQEVQKKGAKNHRKRMLGLDSEEDSHDDEFDDIEYPDESGPKIIVTTSGMAEGPAAFYLEHLGGDSKNLVITVGYQSPGSSGRALQKNCYSLKEGSFDMQVERCDFSAHADVSDIMDFIRGTEAKEVLLVHGEGSGKGSTIDRLQHRCKNNGINAHALDPFEAFSVFGEESQILNRVAEPDDRVDPMAVSNKQPHTINLGPDPPMQTIGHVAETSLLQHDFGPNQQFNALNYDPLQAHRSGPHQAPHSRLSLYQEGVPGSGLGIQTFSHKPIGSRDSGLRSGSRGNIFHRPNTTLQERFDFADPYNPCIDYDLPGVSHSLSQRLLGDIRHVPLDMEPAEPILPSQLFTEAPILKATATPFAPSVSPIFPEATALATHSLPDPFMHQLDLVEPPIPSVTLSGAAILASPLTQSYSQEPILRDW